LCLFFSVYLSLIPCVKVSTSPSITDNGWQLPEGGDFEALHCHPSTNFDRSRKLDLTTEPPLLGSTYVKAVS